MVQSWDPKPEETPAPTASGQPHQAPPAAAPNPKHAAIEALFGQLASGIGVDLADLKDYFRTQVGAPAGGAALSPELIQKALIGMGITRENMMLAARGMADQNAAAQQQQAQTGGFLMTLLQSPTGQAIATGLVNKLVGPDRIGVDGGMNVAPLIAAMEAMSKVEMAFESRILARQDVAAKRVMDEITVLRRGGYPVPLLEDKPAPAPIAIGAAQHRVRAPFDAAAWIKRNGL